MSPSERPVVLHYVGYDDDRGGIVSVVRALAGAGKFDCTLGLNEGAVQRRVPALPRMELPSIAGESIGLRTWWRSRTVARAVREWLRGDGRRIFHGHSRAGLLVARRLVALGEQRVVASVHCYGKQKWFYRQMAAAMLGRIFWLTPAMRAYYGMAGEGWENCVPGCAAPKNIVTKTNAPDGSRLLLGGVGALVSWKNWELVLDALAILPVELRERVVFRHIGAETGSVESRRYAEHLRSRTKKLGLNERVEWRGEQPSSDAFFGEADVLVVASHNEPFSVAMLEALQAGVPVLAADSGGARDIIVPPVNGWLFRSGDAADLSKRIAELATGRSHAAVQIDHALLARFAAAAVAGEWEKIYARLLVAK